jgi:hypothetical protein
MIIVLIWSAIVTSLVNQTQVYQMCKDKECIVAVKDIGYKIELKK